MTRIGIDREEAWCLVGDFNELMHSSETLGGPSREEASFYPFRTMVNSCRVQELPSSGNKFSWAGWREGVWVQSQLDRIFGNADWFTLFPRAHMEYLEMVGSDHRPIFIRLAGRSEPGRGRFMFHKRWIKKPDFREIIQNGWNEQPQAGLSTVMGRISQCRRAISKWKKTTNTNSYTAIQRLKQEWEAQVSSVYPDKHRMTIIRWELALAYREEEIYWKEKSRETWLQEGDRNTRYFQGCVKFRRVKNRITSLVDENGAEQFSEARKGI